MAVVAFIYHTLLKFILLAIQEITHILFLRGQAFLALMSQMKRKLSCCFLFPWQSLKCRKIEDKVGSKFAKDSNGKRVLKAII